jgi:hypothetical protein
MRLLIDEVERGPMQEIGLAQVAAAGKKQRVKDRL